MVELEQPKTLTYRILNRPLTYCGCDRMTFMLAFGMAWELYSLLDSAIAGIAMWLVMFYIGRIQARDPIYLPMQINGHRYKKKLYDPGNRDPFAVLFHD